MSYAAAELLTEPLDRHVYRTRLVTIRCGRDVVTVALEHGETLDIYALLREINRDPVRAEVYLEPTDDPNGFVLRERAAA